MSTISFQVTRSMPFTLEGQVMTGRTVLLAGLPDTETAVVSRCGPQHIISHAESGTRLGIGETPELAIAAAERRLASLGGPVADALACSRQNAHRYRAALWWTAANHSPDRRQPCPFCKQRPMVGNDRASHECPVLGGWIRGPRNDHDGSLWDAMVAVIRASQPLRRCGTCRHLDQHSGHCGFHNFYHDRSDTPALLGCADHEEVQHG